jgi:nitrate reductase beta subunit
MVWYVPPLSPVTSLVEGEGATADPDDVFVAIDRLRIPVAYLASLLSAGDETVIRRVLRQLAAMRSYMRSKTLGEPDAQLARAVGMTPAEIEKMYRLLAVAKYEDRFVVPPAHRELAGELDQQQQGACGLDFPGGPGACADGNGNGAPAAAPANGHFHLHIEGNGRLDELRARRAAEREARRRAPR